MQPPTTIDELIALIHEQDILLKVSIETHKVNEGTITALKAVVSKLTAAVKQRNEMLKECEEVMTLQADTLKKQNQTIIKLGALVGIKPPSPQLPN